MYFMHLFNPFLLFESIAFQRREKERERTRQRHGRGLGGLDSFQRFSFSGFFFMAEQGSEL
jgi:hypothetical protein